MRREFCNALVARAVNPDMVFLTGDLGFMALEPLRDSLGERFINAGVAEQNMLSVAAALAKRGFNTWVYSIASFCYARAFEQIRNDISFPGLPVKIVGNGGGYGYGVMGPTHHAIEDYGVLMSLPNMQAFIPVFDDDVEEVVGRAMHADHPAYLRLGRGEAPRGWAVPTYAPWRKLVDGAGAVVIAVGPLAGSYVEVISYMPDHLRPSLWAVSELPIPRDGIPSEILHAVKRDRTIVVAEEHVAHGGFASDFALHLMKHGISGRLVHLSAERHVFDRYGSQQFLRSRSGLDSDSLLRVLEDLR